MARSTRGYTLLEILVAVVIGAMLVIIIGFGGASMKKRAEKAKCISHMRALHAAFSSYLLDNGRWPQLPAEEQDWDETKYFRFYVESLADHGAHKEMWRCPSDKIGAENMEAAGSEEAFFGSYIPTPFDSRPSTPHRWNQPWIVERGDFHGGGGHMLMPDGSIQQSQNPFYGR